MINLRVQSARAVRLGLAGHVCELQLVLRQFAELQASTVTYLFARASISATLPKQTQNALLIQNADSHAHPRRHTHTT